MSIIDVSMQVTVQTVDLITNTKVSVMLKLSFRVFLDLLLTSQSITPVGLRDT